MEISKITISSEYWDKEDLAEVKSVFNQKVESRKIERWAQESLDPALVITISWIGKEIISGILNALGDDIWKNLKHKISRKVSEREYPGLTLSFQNGDSKLEFELKSKDPKIIERGFDTIDKMLKTINNTGTRIYFVFDNTTEEWKQVEERKFVKIISGVCIGSGTPIIKDGKTFILRDEDLPIIAKMNEGLPFTFGHDGKIIGKVTKTWVEGNLVKFEAGIFDGLSEEEMKKLDEMQGVSMGFTRPEDDEPSV